MALKLEHPATCSPGKLDSPGPPVTGGDTALADVQHCVDVLHPEQATAIRLPMPSSGLAFSSHPSISQPQLPSRQSPFTVTGVPDLWV